MAGGVVNLTYRPTEKYIENIKIDAFLTETYQFSNEVTDVPVEEGVNITDHVVEKADVIQVSAFIGQTEFEAYSGDMPEDLNSLSGFDQKQRIIEIYKKLLKLKRDREPVTVVMGLDTFKNMIITSFNIGRDAETDADLAFDMSFRELKTVKSQSVEINSAQIAKDNSASDQAKPTVDKGPAATEYLSSESEMYKKANRRLDEIGITGVYFNPLEK
jgi:hypothetical protein